MSTVVVVLAMQILHRIGAAGYRRTTHRRGSQGLPQEERRHQGQQ
jgi:hypothetical protein